MGLLRWSVTVWMPWKIAKFGDRHSPMPHCSAGAYDKIVVIEVGLHGELEKRNDLASYEHLGNKVILNVHKTFGAHR